MSVLCAVFARSLNVLISHHHTSSLLNLDNLFQIVKSRRERKTDGEKLIVVVV